jgi:hypothetical protein
VSAGLDHARKAKEALARSVGARDEVNGVGITRHGDGYGVRVNVREDAPDDLDLPSEVDGVPVEVVRVGPVRKREP